MAKFIQIPEIDDFIEHLKFVSSSELYKQRMEAMEELRQDVNKAVSMHQRLEGLDELEAQLRSKMDESAHLRQSAEAYAAQIKAKAEKDVAEILEDISSKQAAMAAASSELDQRTNDLKLREVSADTRQASLDKLALLLKDEASAVKTQAAEAARIKAIYQEKTKQLKAAIGE